MSTRRAGGRTGQERRRLVIGGRLDRYVLEHFVSSYATALLLVVGIFFIFDLASNIDDFLEPMRDGSSIPGLVIARYYLLNLPYRFLEVGPFVTLIAGMFTVNRIQKKNEVVAVLGAGVSVQRLLMPIFFGGLVAALGMFGTREWVSEFVAEKRDTYRDVLVHKRPVRVYEQLFLNDLADNTLRMGRFLPATRGQEAIVLDFEANLRTSEGWTHITAEEALWDGSGWTLTGGLRSVLDRRQERRSSERVERVEGLGFDPFLALTVRRANDAPLELSFAEAEEMLSRDPDDVRYQTTWHYLLTFPLANLVLLLVGLPVMLTHERGGGSERLALGMLLCIFYFAVDFVFRNLGYEGALSPLLAAWIPILTVGSLGIVLLDGIRS